MAAGECYRLVTIAATPHRPNRVNYVLRRQPASWRGDSLTCGQSSLPIDDCLAGLEDRGTTRAMDSAVYAASAHQRGVGGIHDGVAGFARDVARTGDDEATLRRQKDSERMRSISHSEVHSARNAGAENGEASRGVSGVTPGDAKFSRTTRMRSYLLV